MCREDILSKIKKLMNQQESAAQLGNMEEADAFARMAQRMLMQHKIEMSEVEGFSLNKNDIEIDREIHSWDRSVIGRKRCNWKEQLAISVCKHNSCKILVHKGYGAITIIGTKESRMVSSYVLSTLTNFAEREMNRQYAKNYQRAKKLGQTYLMKGWRQSFLLGFIMEIDKRLREERAKVMSEGVSERGLMVLDAEEKAVDDYINNIETVKASSLNTLNAMNGHGYQKGVEAGADVQIHADGVEKEEVLSLT